MLSPEQGAYMRRREFLGVLGGAAAALPLAAERNRRAHTAHRRAPERRRADDPDVQARWRRSCKRCSNWAGPTAATCRSISLIHGQSPTTRENMRRNWLRSPRRHPVHRHRAVGSAAADDAHGADVFVNVADPVGAGFVDSLARPGGNATGFIQFEYSLSAKWLELLKEIAPGVTRAAVLRDPAITAGIGQFAVIQSVAPSVGVEVEPDQRERARRDRARRRGFREFGREAV